MRCAVPPTVLNAVYSDNHPLPLYNNHIKHYGQIFYLGLQNFTTQPYMGRGGARYGQNAEGVGADLVNTQRGEGADLVKIWGGADLAKTVVEISFFSHNCEDNIDRDAKWIKTHRQGWYYSIHVIASCPNCHKLT